MTGVSRSKGPPSLSIEDKVRIVLAVLAGELTPSEAARRHGTTPQTIGKWRDRFLEAGQSGLERQLPGPGKGAGSMAERRMRAENEQLKLALAEATVQLRIWQKGAEHVNRIPSRTSRP
jgi:transposase